jgi:predicted peptidase
MRLALFAIVLGFLSASSIAADDGQVLSRTIEMEGRTYGWQVFVPAAVLSGEDTKPPVILFLHGAGQLGSDGVRQTEIGLPAVLRERSGFPALVVMPQSPRGAWWGTPEIERMALAALDAAVGEFGGDPERTYLTGLSLGGYGTWALAYRHPERFAALVPVCGGVTTRRSRMPVPDWHPSATHPDDPWAETARVIADIPVWVFHGGEDRRVPTEESRRMVAALEAAGAAPRYTEYPGVAHNSWVPAYREEGLYEWLFSQRRSGP